VLLDPEAWGGIGGILFGLEAPTFADLNSELVYVYWCRDGSNLSSQKLFSSIVVDMNLQVMLIKSALSYEVGRN
jgi:hypothetical protein